MTRQIRLSFVDEGVSAVAELLDSAAPRTSQVIWNALPLDGEVLHAVYSGSEIVFLIPAEIFVEPENATSRVAVGDVGYWFQKGGRVYGFPDDLSEIAWFYDRDATPSMADGPIQMSIFARIVGDAEAFYRVCRLTRREGAKRVQVQRLE